MINETSILQSSNIYLLKTDNNSSLAAHVFALVGVVAQSMSKRAFSTTI